MRSMGEISEGVGRSRSEIFRMLQVLEERGYLTKGPGEGGYVLTNRLFMLGMQQPQVQNVTEAALPARWLNGCMAMAEKLAEMKPDRHMFSAIRAMNCHRVWCGPKAEST